MKIEVTEQVEVTYTVELFDDVVLSSDDIKEGKLTPFDNQPPREAWCEAVLERSWVVV